MTRHASRVRTTIILGLLVLVAGCFPGKVRRVRGSDISLPESWQDQVVRSFLSPCLTDAGDPVNAPAVEPKQREANRSTRCTMNDTLVKGGVPAPSTRVP